MVRPFYWGLAYGEYRIGAEGRRRSTLVNWLATGAALLAAGLALASAFRVRCTELAPSSSALYGAAVFVFPWTLDLFAFPSYQEKWVMLGAALALLVVRLAAPRASGLGVVRGQRARHRASARRRRRSSSSICRRSCCSSLHQRNRGEASWARVAFVTAIGIAAAVALRAVAWYGSYTSDFSTDNVLDAAPGPPLLAAVRARRRVDRLRDRSGRPRPRERSGST